MIECIKSNYKDHISSDEQRETIKEEIKKVKDEWIKEWDNLLNSDMNPINPYRILKVLPMMTLS